MFNFLDLLHHLRFPRVFTVFVVMHPCRQNFCLCVSDESVLVCWSVRNNTQHSMAGWLLLYSQQLSHYYNTFILSHFDNTFMLAHYNNTFILSNYDNTFMLAHYTNTFILSYYDNTVMFAHSTNTFILSHIDNTSMLAHYTDTFILSYYDNQGSYDDVTTQLY